MVELVSGSGLEGVSPDSLESGWGILRDPLDGPGWIPVDAVVAGLLRLSKTDTALLSGIVHDAMCRTPLSGGRSERAVLVRLFRYGKGETAVPALLVEDGDGVPVSLVPMAEDPNESGEMEFLGGAGSPVRADDRLLSPGRLRGALLAVCLSEMVLCRIRHMLASLRDDDVDPEGSVRLMIRDTMLGECGFQCFGDSRFVLDVV